MFPFAGGGASVFAEWQSYFPDSIETYAIQYPDRETRWGEPPYHSLPDLVAAIADELIPRLPAPFAFLGHSMGGLVAFELTRLLAQRIWKLPVHLFVAGVSPPHVPRTARIHQLPDRQFIAALCAYGGVPRAVLDHPEFLTLLLPVIRNDFRLYEEHVLLPSSVLPVPITAFGGLQDHKALPHNLHAWALHTSGSFTGHLLPGQHFFLFDSGPQVAARILSELQRSLAPTQDISHG